MTTREHDDEFAAIAADDALLDALASGGAGLTVDAFVPAQAGAGNGSAAHPDDAVALLLRGWRRELDAVDPATSVRGFAVVPPASTSAPAARAGWLRRHTAGVAAASVVVLVGSTGVAAAESGRSGPLAAVHRVLFGAPAPDDSAALARVTALLDGVATDLQHAHVAGGATAAQLADMGDRLDTAGRMLAADPAAPVALTARLAELRADLATIDTLPTNSPAVGSSGQSARTGDTGSHGGSNDPSTSGDGGRDGSGSTDGSGSGGSDGGSGSGDGSGAGTTTSDGGTSGSDGGSTSDGGTSGSGGSTSDGGTTSDGGSTSSDGGTTSGSGSTSSDGGSTSGSGSTSSDGGSTSGSTTSDGGSSDTGSTSGGG